MSERLPTLTQVAQAYDVRYAEGDLREADAFYRWVLRCLAPAPAGELLDVSCGEGHLLHWAGQGGGLGLWGIDISAEALRRAQGRAAAARLIRCDGIRLPFPAGSFDYVTNLGSLEHYSDISQGVREMARVLKPSGRTAILLPNSYYLGDIIWQVWRTGYGPSHRQLLEQFATLGEWRDLLAEGGIETMRVLPYNFSFPRSVADWRWYRQRPRKALNLLLGPFTPRNLAYCFLFIGRRSPTVA
jgi:SAM-dependent methyltransferase